MLAERDNELIGDTIKLKGLLCQWQDPFQFLSFVLLPGWEIF